MQSHDERINIIREAVNNVKTESDLDLNNVSFAALSDKDNYDLTNAEQVYIDND